MNRISKHNNLYNIAENQAGYFTSSQARLAGFSRERLSYYVKSNLFARIRHGIYRLIHFPASPNEDLFIAWLMTGNKSIISHESALNLFGLSDVLPGEIHVIIPRSASRRRKGIRLHTIQVNPDEITYREGLPVTNVARTIVDVATSGLAEEHIKSAIFQAIRNGMMDKNELLTAASGSEKRVLSIIKKILDSEIE